MENEFIPYEQSLALKKLGFKEPCFGAWVNNELFITENEKPKIQSLSINQCTAPLYQQAFRFFRDRYKIDSFIIIRSVFYSSDIVIGGVGMGIGTNYPIYEDAQIECLNRLIEIAKEHKDTLWKKN
jgi:hypothetical protein